MRVLVVVPPLTGHVNPTVALGRELVRRGHEVAWTGHADAVAPLLPPGARLLPLEHDLSPEAYAAIRARGLGLRGAAAFKFLFEDLFLPLARGMLPGVEAAIDTLRPDVLVVDQQAYGGALAARRRGLPFVTSASTSANLVDPFATLPQLRAFMDDHLVRLQEEAGLPGTPDGLLSPRAVVAWSTRALVGEAPLPPRTVLVGPALGARGEAPAFPWARLEAHAPPVLISLGTVNADVGGRFFAEALEAARDAAWQAVIVAPEGLLRDVPDRVIVRPRVPQLDLLPHLGAVVCHGGHNTVVEALAHGLPLVVAPIRDDQPVVAQQVVEAGAGVRVKFGRVRAEALRAAVDAVLGEPGFRGAAGRIRASFAEAGGAVRAAEVVEAAAG